MAVGAAGARFAVLPEDDVTARAAQALAEQKAVGWMQGGWRSARALSGANHSRRSALSLLRKEDQDPALKLDYKAAFDPD